MAIEWWTALAVLIVAIAAERAHARRTAAIAPMLLGRSNRFTLLAKASPYLRACALAAITWGLTVLLATPPQRWAGNVTAEKATEPKDLKRLVILLDVSPSMALPDAGGVKQKRSARAAAVLNDFMGRIDLDQTRVTVVPFYSSARPVVVDAVDPQLVHFVATESSLDLAFDAGRTDLNISVNDAMDLTRDWRPDSTTLLVVTDGDSVSKTRLNTRPSAINRVLVTGVGDSIEGTFIDGHVSRHDPDNLREMALRLGGTYFNADRNFVPTGELDAVSGALARTVMPPIGRRDVALATFAVGAVILAVLPLLLTAFGVASRLAASPRKSQQAALVGGAR